MLALGYHYQEQNCHPCSAYCSPAPPSLWDPHHPAAHLCFAASKCDLCADEASFFRPDPPACHCERCAGSNALSDVTQGVCHTIAADGGVSSPHEDFNYGRAGVQAPQWRHDASAASADSVLAMPNKAGLADTSSAACGPPDVETSASDISWLDGLKDVPPVPAFETAAAESAQGEPGKLQVALSPAQNSAATGPIGVGADHDKPVSPSPSPFTAGIVSTDPSKDDGSDPATDPATDAPSDAPSDAATGNTADRTAGPASWPPRPTVTDEDDDMTAPPRPLPRPLPSQEPPGRTNLLTRPLRRDGAPNPRSTGLLKEEYIDAAERFLQHLTGEQDPTARDCIVQDKTPLKEYLAAMDKRARPPKLMQLVMRLLLGGWRWKDIGKGCEQIFGEEYNEKSLTSTFNRLQKKNLVLKGKIYRPKKDRK